MQTATARLLAIGIIVLSINAARAQDSVAREKAGASAQKADDPAPVQTKLGEPAPEFTLLDSTGTKHRLSDYKDKLVVLEWVNQQCPFSVKAVPVGKELRKKYEDKGVVWLGIESTFNRKPEENAQYIKDKGLTFPILMDSDGKVGRMYGAKVTPHIFVVNKGQLVYAGALLSKPDTDQKESTGRNYVDEALAAVLAGKPVPLAETTPWGCNVKYKPAGDPKDDQPPAAKKEK